jgi:hypothetical protein
MKKKPSVVPVKTLSMDICERIDAAREIILLAQAISHALTLEPEKDAPPDYQFLSEHIAKLLLDASEQLGRLVDELGEES